MSANRYVKTGITGYGPDLEESDEPAEDVQQLCYMIRDEISAATDMLHEDAYVASGEHDYKRYHDARELADSLWNVSAVLDYDRRLQAPMYVGRPETLDAVLLAVIDQSFPLDVDVDGNRRLYVWDAE